MHDFLGLPLQASAHAHEIDASITLIHWLMLVLFVGWSSFFLYTLIRFRRSAHPKADYVGLRTKLPFVIVGAVAIFEVILLGAIDLPLWAKLTTDIPPESESTVVRVVAEQFAWNIHYPGNDGRFGRTAISLISSDNPLGLDRDDPDAKDDITTINQLNLPVNKPVIVYLSSKDVIHSFGIPLFRVKQDAIPGQRVRVSFTPTMTSSDIVRRGSRKHPIHLAMDTQVFSAMLAMDDYKDKDGNPILSKGDPIEPESIEKLVAAGYGEVYAGPSTPIEIACSQLCGLGHFRMRGFVTVQTEDEFKAWLAEQASYLTQ